MSAEIELLKLAKERYTNLSPAEEKFFRAVAKGEPADFSGASDEENDPSHADKWPAERALNADRLAWLCTNSAASKLVTHRGILVLGAQVNGILNLEWTDITFLLNMRNCAFSGSILLNQANLSSLDLFGTHIKDLRADGAKFEGTVFLRNVKTEGEVRFMRTTFAADLDFSGGQFINAKATAINADGVRIEGVAFLRNVKTEGEVRFLGATVAASLDFSGGQFINAKATAINADGVRIEGAVFLRNVKTEGGVRFSGATIATNLDFSDGQFINANAYAINADVVKIKGAVFLRNVKTEGEVRFLGATIGVDLDCVGGQFINAKGIALNADGVKIAGAVFLRNGFKAEGEVRFIGATIRTNLECLGEFSNAKATAFNAEGVKIGGAVHLRNGLKAEGAVWFVGATIGGDFNCDGGQFVNAGAIALIADRVKVEGAVFLRNGFKAEGAVRFLGASIGTSLECAGEFINAKEIAFAGDGAKIEGAVFLHNGFKAEGQVRLVGATIALDLDCSGGQFINVEAVAFAGDGVKISGNVFLRNGFKAEGEVRFIGATIALDLDCSGGTFINANTNADSFALQADGTKINGSLYLNRGFEADGKLTFISASVARHIQWWGVKSPEKVIFDLRSTKVGTLWDEKKSWPQAGNLFINGFVYDEIHHFAPTDAKSRINWLERQPPGQFLPQPYEQLAGVLRKMGHENEADKVMIEKNDDIARRITFFHPGRWLQFFFKLFVGYGYRPWRAFGWSLLIITIGTLLFSSGNRVGIMTPTKENAYVSRGGGTQRLSEDYPKFNSFIYSLEMFTPLLKLEMGDYWQPNANRGEQLVMRGISLPTNGSLLRGYLWFHIILGWVLTTLWVGGLTGLVKK